jgi:hypothetical protein
MADIVHAGFRFSSSGEWHFVLRTGAISPAIVHEGWARDGEQQAYVTFSDPATGDYVHGGQRYTADGAAYVTASAIAAGDYVHDGIRRDALGRMYITSGAPAVGDYVHGGIRRTANGVVYAGGTVLEDYVVSLTPVAWYKYNTGVAASQWDDQSGNDNHLVQATATNQPAVQPDGSLLFDGVDNFMKAAFTLNEPETIYLLFKQVTWTDLRRIFDGNTGDTGAVFQGTSTPLLRQFITAATNNNNALAVDTYGAFGVVFNGASSATQVNLTTVSGGNPGTANMGGLTLGARGNNTGPSNIQVKEVIVFGAAHSAETRRRVIRYLAAVGGLSF